MEDENDLYESGLEDEGINTMPVGEADVIAESPLSIASAEPPSYRERLRERLLSSIDTSEAEAKQYGETLAKIDEAKKNLLQAPDRRQYLQGLASKLTAPRTQDDPRFFERRNLFTFLRDVGEYGQEQRTAEKERQAKLVALQEMQAKYGLEEAQKRLGRAEQLAAQYLSREPVQAGQRTRSSEFERLLEDIPEDQREQYRRARLGMLTERPTAAKKDDDLPTGQLGQFVQARRILANPEASPADKEAAQAFMDSLNKGKLSRANETQKAMLGNIESSFINIFDTLSKAEKIIADNPQTTTGVAAYLSYLPATDARTLSNYVQTIKANIGFDELQKMRMASPTGGALGQVAVQELQFLQSKIATLDQFADREVLLDQLNQIRASYNRWRDTVQQFYDEADAGLEGEGAAPSAPGVDLDAVRKALEKKTAEEEAARGAQ